MSEKSGFFPLFMDLREKKLLFIGGGRIAARRVKVLSAFDTEIVVLAPVISESLKELADSKEIICRKKNFDEADLDGADIVFACTDDEELNHWIYRLCKEKDILVNNCSNRQECDFYFPAIVAKENVVVGVNAGGKDHCQAKEIRKKIEGLLS